MKLTAPYVNLNGNSKDGMLNEIWDTVQSINVAIENTAKCDYDDGRNSLDNEHRIMMRNEKRSIIDKLHEIKESFTDLYNEIREK